MTRFLDCLFFVRQPACRMLREPLYGQIYVKLIIKYHAVDCCGYVIRYIARDKERKKVIPQAESNIVGDFVSDSCCVGFCFTP